MNSAKDALRQSQQGFQSEQIRISSLLTEIRILQPRQESCSNSHKGVDIKPCSRPRLMAERGTTTLPVDNAKEPKHLQENNSCSARQLPKTCHALLNERQLHRVQYSNCRLRSLKFMQVEAVTLCCGRRDALDCGSPGRGVYRWTKGPENAQMLDGLQPQPIASDN